MFITGFTFELHALICRKEPRHYELFKADLVITVLVCLVEVPLLVLDGGGVVGPVLPVMVGQVFILVVDHVVVLLQRKVAVAILCVRVA